MLSSPFDNTHNQMKSGVECFYGPLASHTIILSRAWITIVTIRNYTMWDDVRHGIPKSSLGSTRGRTMLGVTCHLRLWIAHTVVKHWAWYIIIALVQLTWSDDDKHSMPSWTLQSTHGRTTSGIACIHLPWEAYMVMECYHLPYIEYMLGRCEELNYIISLGPPTRSNNVSLSNAIVSLGKHTHSDDSGR